MCESDRSDVERFKSDAKDFVHRALREIKNSSATKQIVVGSASGW